MPSGISGFICITIGLALVIAHIVLLSVSFGTSLPGVLDGQWSAAYTENIVQPLSTFFANNTFNKLIVAALWGAVGLGVYMGFEYSVHTYKTAQETKRQVALGTNGNWSQRPMRSYFWSSFIWRVSMIALGILYLVLVQPLLRFAMDAAPQLVVSQNIVADSPKALVAALIWAFFLHGCLVIMRLYTQRTRLLGDDILY
jgi:hypothetical protein